MNEQMPYPDKQDALLNEFASMRNTLANMIQLIKQQDERIKALEESQAENNAEQNRARLLRRYSENLSQHKPVRLDPWQVALVAHLSIIKQLPATTIVNTGLASKWKLHTVLSWDIQHLLDYCELNDVIDIYEHGLSIYKLREYLPYDPEVYNKLYDVLKDIA